MADVMKYFESVLFSFNYVERRSNGFDSVSFSYKSLVSQGCIIVTVPGSLTQTTTFRF